jgi:hypothetical protein
MNNGPFKAFKKMILGEIFLKKIEIVTHMDL